MQIERAKWKNPVMIYGDVKCKKCFNIIDNISCPKCNGLLFWVDPDARYVICKGCKENNLRKVGKPICNKCGEESSYQIKPIRGYRP